MAYVRWVRLAWASVAPLALAGILTLPPAAATADTTCSTWNGAQPVSETGGSGDANQLEDVTVVAPCDVWAIGYGTPSGFDQTLIEHWTGSSWTVVSSPSPGGNDALEGMSAVSASDIWAVGSTSSAPDYTDKTLILHWNGAQWLQQSTPSLSGTGASLFAVDALSATDAWAVGANTTAAFVARPLVLHWDGSAWNPFQAPDLPNVANLVSVSATADGDLWAIANTSTGPVMVHWNGSGWTQYAITNAADPELDSVAALSPGNAWAVGSYVSNGVAQTLVEHWDGNSWTQLASPDPGGTTHINTLASISAASATDIWAVGSINPNGTIFGPRTPLVLHWDGSSWTAMAVDAPGQGIPNRLTTVSASSTGQAWVAGESGDFSTLFAAPVPVVPVVNGDLVGQAFATLATYGLRGGSLIQTTNCPASSSGLVIGSDPTAGQIETVGLAVNLFVCATPATVTVPNVLSFDDASARSVITAAGLTVVTITPDNRCIADAGTVLVQNPGGGASAAPGTAVNLTESSGHTSTGKACIID